MLFAGILFAATLVIIVGRDDSIKWISIFMAIIFIGFLLSWKLELPIIFVACGIPISLICAWFSRDELLIGRRWFVAIIIAGLAGVVYSFIINDTAGWMMSLFMIIISGGALKKSYDRKWTRKEKV